MNYWNRAIISAVCFSTMMISGCATVVKGNDQGVTIDTHPQGASCTLSRDGATIAVVNPTPGTVQIDRDKDAISIICKKENFLDSTDILSSEFNGVTLGNILVGGIIGIAVDAGSGAMHDYPSMITVTLIPEEFETAEARDKFFDDAVLRYQEESEAAIEKLSKRCSEETCEQQMKEAREKQEQRVADLEQKRALARVAQN
ncbi:MAG: hypothetical protein MI754_18975 [Chromatiales bacterium]|nr:hypothetical protein [Chromatiales bacterium]